MTDKKPVPPSLAQFALEQLAEAGEQTAIDLAVKNVEILRAEIVKRDARIAELELDQRRFHDAQFNLKSLYKRAAIALSLDQDNTSWFEIVGDLEKVAALKEQQLGGVALPDGWVSLRIEHEPGYPEDVAFGPQIMMDRLKKWLDRYFDMRLNPCRAQAVPDGWRDVQAERQRQISAEGWTPEHDAEHDGGELAAAGAAYALHAADHLHPYSQGDGGNEAPSCWPWHDELAGRGEGPVRTEPAWWKPGTPRRNLIKAGALILAEIERLDRAAAPSAQQKES